MQNNEYLSRFSHELRNPLTLIYSSLQLLEKECPAVRKSDLWEPIRKDMLDVLQFLKEMSVSAGEAHPVPVCLAEFFSDLSASFAPSVEMRGIRFVTELPDELSGTSVMADRQKLRQAVLNLLLNAADAVSGSSGAVEPVTGCPCSDSSAADCPHSGSFASAAPALSSQKCHGSSDPEGHTPGTILLSAVRDGDDVCLHVRDNGPGIPQEYLTDLFEPFVTHKAGGTGLGLGIVLTIAEQLGGSISVDTRSSDNSAAASSTYTDFCLRLPLCDGRK